MALSRSGWRSAVGEPVRLALDAIRLNPARAALAVSGVVVGIVTVVLVASTLANIRNQVALLFRDLGTDNVFAFHLTGDPYVTPPEKEGRRKPLKVAWAAELARRGRAIRDVAVQIIIPTANQGQVLTARAGGAESDTVFVEAASPNYFDVVGAEFTAGRPFSELENRSAARVVVVGASLARALYGARPAVGQSLVMGGDTYAVVGEMAKRRGGFFGENRQDNTLVIPERRAQVRFRDPERVILYARAKPGELEVAYREVEAILRQLRKLPAEADNDFTLSTAEQIIATLDAVSRQIAVGTVALAAVSLIIGAIGIANVMFISATERTREIGLRLAVGARRSAVLRQFLIEAAVLSAAGGAVGIVLALMLGLGITLVVTTFSAMPPLWAVAAGLVASVAVGVVAGYLPARRAARLDPVEALRYE